MNVVDMAKLEKRVRAQKAYIRDAQWKDKPKMPECNRVWIELEPATDCKEGDIRAARANDMLKRLGVTIPTNGVFWYNARTGMYCVTIDSGGSFLECTDNGHWFNLDFLSGSNLGLKSAHPNPRR